MNGRRLIQASERWFRLLVKLYPADFRDEMGEGLVEAYLERAREASGSLRLAGVWLAALRDSVRNGFGERVRPAAHWRRPGDWGRDMELVSRRFAQKPLFLAAVLGTLSVGLGTFAVVYTAVDKILLEPLPYPNPEDLYMIWGTERDLNHLMVTGPEIADLQRAGGVIEAAAGFQYTSTTLMASAEADAMRIPALVASPNLFDLLGVRPALGRGFRPEEVGPGAPNVIVLTDALWKRLGGDPAILGRDIKLAGETCTVIGVMPPGFQFSGSRAAPSAQPDVYATFSVNLAAMNPGSSNYHAVLRARHGTPPETLHREVDAVGRFAGGRDRTNRGIFAIGLHTEMVDEVRPALLALGFAGVFLVLVLTVNLASLLLARAAEREREFAVARALGASGPAVVRATLIEGGLLGLIGGGAGALAGVWGTRLLVALGPSDLPRRETIVLDGGIAAVVIAVSVVLGLMAAAVPAIWAARVSLPSLLSNTAVRGGASSSRMRRALIVVQVALSLVLLSTAGLVVRSFEKLLDADPGFRPEGVLTFSVGLNVFNRDASLAFQDRVDEALRALPGVTAVSATSRLPLSGMENVPPIEMPGAAGNTGDAKRDRPTVARIFTRAGYATAIGMRLVEGRDLGIARRDGVREALIDRRLAQQFFPNSSPLGATVKAAGDEPATIVGVIEHARLSSLHEDDENPHLLVRAEDYRGRSAALYVVRTGRDPHALIPEVRLAIRQIDARVPVSDVRTMEEIVADTRSEERISAILIAGLALGALLLVAMGLFGMMSGSVTRRRGEIAVRLALGSTHQRVIGLVVGEGARLVVLGLLIGLPGVWMAGEALQGFLIGVPPDDTPTLAAVAVGLAAVALLACYLAARRVTTIEPGRLLREGG